MHFDVVELKVQRVKDAERIKLKWGNEFKMKCHPFKSTNIFVAFSNSRAPFYSIWLKLIPNQVEYGQGLQQEKPTDLSLTCTISSVPFQIETALT